MVNIHRREAHLRTSPGRWSRARAKLEPRVPTLHPRDYVKIDRHAWNDPGLPRANLCTWASVARRRSDGTNILSGRQVDVRAALGRGRIRRGSAWLRSA